MIGNHLLVIKLVVCFWCISNYWPYIVIPFHANQVEQMAKFVQYNGGQINDRLSFIKKAFVKDDVDTRHVAVR